MVTIYLRMSGRDTTNVTEQVDQYDVAVVGCGMAGLTAGLSAACQGVSVVILEKAPGDKRGGQTQYTELFRVATAELDIEQNIPEYTATEFYQDVMKLSNAKADPDLTSTFTKNSAETFQWLRDKLRAEGHEWEHNITRPGVGRGIVEHDGNELVDHLVAATETAGAEIMYQTEARELLQDETGAVSGVIAKQPSGRTRYDTDAVILASGGFEAETRKRAQYLGKTYDEMKVRGVRYNTGTPIEMALDIGAKSTGQWSGAHMTLIDGGSPDVEGGQTLPSGYNYGILLNHDGERFLDEGEDMWMETYAKFGEIVFEQPYQEAFVIHSASTNDHVVHTGPTKPITADSIDELVQRLDIKNQEKAIETFEEYNAACDPQNEFIPNELDGNSCTDVPLPKSNWAVPLEETPLFAYPVTGGITFTYGGLAQNTDSQIVDTSHNPIEGLYGAGNVTGGIFYTNYIGGSALTKAAVFGKLAGEHAANLSAT